MLPVVIPLRLFLSQLFCISMGLAIEASVLSKRAELPRQVAFHYSLVANVVAMFAGWAAIFAVQEFFLRGVRGQQVLSYIFSGAFITEFALVPTQVACMTLAIVFFVGGFLLKPYSVRKLEQFDLVPPLPEMQVGRDDPRLKALVEARLRERVAEAMQLGHIASTIATMLFFALLIAW